MPLHVAQVIFPYFTGIPTDVTVNRFHFQSDGLLDSQVAELLDTRLTDFYQTIYGSTAATHANYVDWPSIQLKVFNLDDTPPRIPEVRTMAMTAGTGTTVVPTEVACVLTWHAAPASGVRFQRLYNRIYLGHLMSSAMSPSAVDAFPVLASGFITSVRTAAQDLLDANSSLLDWVQVSNAGGTTAVRAISGGWVDNSPDTQRRRSVIASARNTWAPL